MIDMEHTALLIIDMPNDFIHPDGFFRKSSRGVGLVEDSLELLTPPIPLLNLAGVALGYPVVGCRVNTFERSREPVDTSPGG